MHRGDDIKVAGISNRRVSSKVSAFVLWPSCRFLDERRSTSNSLLVAMVRRLYLILLACDLFYANCLLLVCHPAENISLGSALSLVQAIIIMVRYFPLLTLCAIAPSALGASSLTYGPSTFTAPGTFPTSLYEHYYNSPTATSAQVQPVISDPVTVSLPMSVVAARTAYLTQS